MRLAPRLIFGCALSCWQVMSYGTAVRRAEESGLDLIDVAPNARPPVLRLGNAKAAAQRERVWQKELRRKDLDNRKKQVAKEASTHFLLAFCSPACCVGTHHILPCRLIQN